MGEAKIREANETEETAAKAKEFSENPEHFIHVGDCIAVVSVKRNEAGKITHYAMNSNILTEDEGHIAKGRANMIIDTAIVGLVRQKAQAAKSGIIPATVVPGNGNRIISGR